MLDRSPRRSVSNFRIRVGGGSVNMVVIELESRLMKPITIVGIIFFTIVISAAATWTTSTYVYRQKSEEDLVYTAQLHTAFASAVFSNMVYHDLKTLDDHEFGKKKDKQLIGNIINLFCAESHAIDDHDGSLVSAVLPKKREVLQATAKSLKLLGVDSAESLRQKMIGLNYNQGFVDSQQNLNIDLSEFVTEALSDRTNRARQ